MQAKQQTAISFAAVAEDRSPPGRRASHTDVPLKSTHFRASLPRGFRFAATACGLRKPARWTSPFFRAMCRRRPPQSSRKILWSLHRFSFPKKICARRRPHARRCSERRERQLRNR